MVAKIGENEASNLKKKQQCDWWDSNDDVVWISKFKTARSIQKTHWKLVKANEWPRKFE